jgi:hypothetical protein
MMALAVGILVDLFEHEVEAVEEVVEEVVGEIAGGVTDSIDRVAFRDARGEVVEGGGIAVGKGKGGEKREEKRGVRWKEVEGGVGKAKEKGTMGKGKGNGKGTAVKAKGRGKGKGKGKGKGRGEGEVVRAEHVGLDSIVYGADCKTDIVGEIAAQDTIGSERYRGMGRRHKSMGNNDTGGEGGGGGGRDGRKGEGSGRIFGGEQVNEDGAKKAELRREMQEQLQRLRQRQQQRRVEAGSPMSPEAWHGEV